MQADLVGLDVRDRGVHADPRIGLPELDLHQHALVGEDAPARRPAHQDALEGEVDDGRVADLAGGDQLGGGVEQHALKAAALLVSVVVHPASSPVCQCTRRTIGAAARL